MPELPEVETIVSGLRNTIIGKTVSSCRVLDKRPLQNCSEQTFAGFVKNEKVENIERFGKYLHFIFTSGKSFVSHLRMTGKYIYCNTDTVSPDGMKHVRVQFSFSDRTLLLFKDIRIFGTIAIYDKGADIPEKNKVGVEPLGNDFTAEYLAQAAQKRSLSIKQFLLDQKVIAGLGNIYVCEALFMSGINPMLPAGSLTREQAVLLVKYIKAVLKKAIKNNGTSVSDFRNVDDKTGNFQNMLMVYQRGNQSCKVCKKSDIQRVVQGQRSTFYCPVCQS